MICTYRFCDDLISTELDLNAKEQNIAYKILETINGMYKNNTDDTFSELKKLIKDSKHLYGTIKLVVMSEGSLETGYCWDGVDTIYNELPTNLTEYQAYEFMRGLIFELCNSVNRGFNEIENIKKLAHDHNSYAFLMELLEYETVQRMNSIMMQIKECQDQIEWCAEIYENIGKMKKIISSCLEKECLYTPPTFIEVWEHVNSVKSSGYAEHSHAEFYRRQYLEDTSNLSQQLTISNKSEADVELLKNANSIRDIWLHKTEFSLFKKMDLLFSFGKETQINIVGGVLNIDKNGATYASVKRICYHN